MFSDGESVSVPGPEPLVHRPVEQLLQDVLRVRGEVVLELELPLEHSLRDGLPVGAGEGRGSGQHVMNQDAETPPVHLLAMSTNKVETLIVLRSTLKGERERRNERFKLKKLAGIQTKY